GLCSVQYLCPVSPYIPALLPARQKSLSRSSQKVPAFYPESDPHCLPSLPQSEGLRQPWRPHPASYKHCTCPHRLLHFPDPDHRRPHRLPALCHNPCPCCILRQFQSAGHRPAMKETDSTQSIRPQMQKPLL